MNKQSEYTNQTVREVTLAPVAIMFENEVPANCQDVLVFTENEVIFL